MSAAPSLRQLGNSELKVTPVGFGCWPIAGISSLGVSDEHSIATIHAAIDAGINFVDTAYSYGYDGEADKLLARVLDQRRHEIVLASKVGQYFGQERTRVVDGRPETLLAQAEAILDRLGIDHVDVMYLHKPDSSVPIEESAGAMAELIRRGQVRYAGVSNMDSQQLARFHAECPVVVVQPPFNMLQQEQVRELRDTCRRENIAIACYWALMKGLLAGKLPRDHQFDPRDKRLTYPVFQGDAWQRSQDLLDRLRTLAQEQNCTVAQLVVAWTIHQPGLTVALCGAKRPEQIEETAAAMHVPLDPESLASIDRWIEETQVEIA